MLRFLSIVFITTLSASDAVAQSYPAPVEADFVVRNYRFESGETLAEVKLHYRTVGSPKKDADGVVRNAVLILHGTGGTGRGFVTDGYAGRLFGKGQLLDAERYFIILPDNLGHGASSKPSDGLRMQFPKYRYTDMVKLQHALMTAGPGPLSPAPGDRHVDGSDAHVDVGLPVSRVRGRARTVGEQSR